MDQYLHWDSLHPISSKYSVVGTLHHRAKTICSNKQLLKEEEDHLAMALKNCNYPMWALNRIKIKMNNPAHRNKNKTGPTQQSNTPKPHITVPYYRGLSESVKKRCSNYGVQAYFRGGTIIKNLLMAPKDLDPMMKKVGSSTVTNVVGWSVMKNTKESPQGPLGRGSRNTKRPPSPYLTILTPLVTV